MFKITGNTITLTRGDTLKATVGMRDKDTGDPYVPVAGDVIRFALKKNYEDASPLIVKIVPNETQLLHLEPSDTKSLPFGNYVYDIEITFANGDVDTFIDKAKFVLEKEVY